VPHLIEVWKAGAPTIDIIAPDVYFGRLDEWSACYRRRDNPLFVPEIKNDESVAVHALFAFGEGAIGFSPFAIELTAEKPASQLARVYGWLRSLEPAASPSVGVLVDREHPARTLVLGEYALHVSHDYTFPWAAPATKDAPWPLAGGMILAIGQDEYLAFGSGFIVTFAPTDGKGQVGIDRVDLGELQKGRFVATRRLNGDETHQGRHVRLPMGGYDVQRVKLYRY
jgi:hypothetical protein